MNPGISKASLALATFLIAATGLLGFSQAASAVPARPASPPPTDYWQDLGFINMAHQGGEQEAPGNTLFAYKTAIAAGADMIDMDAYLTADNQLVLTHDLRAARTSNAPDDPAHEIPNLTLAQLRQFDFAYWFTPWFGTYYDHNDASKVHPYRGIATGDVPPPAGFTAADFQIATFDQVLEAFPDTPINIELKVPGVNPQAIAQKAADILAAHPGREKNVIVNSFGQATLDAFHAAAPNHLSMGGSLEGTLDYVTGSAITPTPVSVQPPDLYDLGGLVRTVPILKPTTDYDGYTIVVWGSDLDPLQDTWPFYAKLVQEGADAYNTTRPSVLHNYLCNAGIRRPDGTQRCGMQPPDVIPCPEGTAGTAPTCIPIPPDPLPKLRIYLVYGPKTVKAGSKFWISVTLGNSGGEILPNANVCLAVPQIFQKKVKRGPCAKTGSIGAGRIIHRNLSARATANARGVLQLNVKVTGRFGNAASGGWTGMVVPKKCKSGRRGSGNLCVKTNHF